MEKTSLVKKERNWAVSAPTQMQEGASWGRKPKPPAGEEASGREAMWVCGRGQETKGKHWKTQEEKTLRLSSVNA